MKSLLGTLLCVGLAACSHDRPAESASSVSDPTAYDASTTRDPSMTPASADNAAPRTVATADANRRSAGPLQPEMGMRPTDPASPNRAGSDTSASNRDVRDASAAPSTIGTEDGSRTGASSHSSSSSSSEAAPDNTKVNERDRNAQAPTPTKQGNDQVDLRITQQIRQAVMSDKSLSFTAKNVKIITSGGHVVLRGTVKTDAERSSIESAARKVAGDGQVENLIEVKQ